MKITARRVLRLIENHVANIMSLDTELTTIYMWVHTANEPKCRANHPQWTADLIKKLKEPEAQK